MSFHRIRLVEFGLCVLITVVGASSVSAMRHQGNDLSPGDLCVSNVKQISAGMIMYSQDYDDVLPLKKEWSTIVSPYVKSKSMFHCPSVPKDKFGYAYNFVCSSHNTTQLGPLEKMAVIFDSTQLQKDNVTTLVSLPRPGRHEGKDTIGYLDGHVKATDEHK